MIKFIQNIKEYFKSRNAKLEIAKNNEAYLINAFADKSYLERIIKNVQKCPDVTATLYTLDGMRLEILNRKHNKDTNKRPIIGAYEYD